MAAISAHYFGLQRTHLKELAYQAEIDQLVNPMATMGQRLYFAHCHAEAWIMPGKSAVLT